LNAYPARATPKYIFNIATASHTATNANVATRIRRGEFPIVFAAVIKTPQTKNPPKIIIAVRISHSLKTRRAYHTVALRLSSMLALL
jgi:CO/xanthine dehydrogenase FAD-binding subunit